MDTMRTDVIYGQYLDVTTTGEPSPDMDRAMAIIQYRTAKCPCERPLHIRILLGAAAPPLLRPRRRAAVGLLPRGARYGLGTGAVGLATFWVQSRLKPTVSFLIGLRWGHGQASLLVGS
ncbi:hypothetical protein [Streptomyces sp. NPDC017991]|uniref:hypothetical protein n=1 Tax=Streptomyces sp. NPDC017991 TaxID=3365026 RepID=UPI0037A8E226